MKPTLNPGWFRYLAGVACALALLAPPGAARAP